MIGIDRGCDLPAPVYCDALCLTDHRRLCDLRTFEQLTAVPSLHPQLIRRMHEYWLTQAGATSAHDPRAPTSIRWSCATCLGNRRAIVDC